jgi:hypothetical protein
MRTRPLGAQEVFFESLMPILIVLHSFVGGALGKPMYAQLWSTKGLYLLLLSESLRAGKLKQGLLLVLSTESVISSRGSGMLHGIPIVGLNWDGFCAEFSLLKPFLFLATESPASCVHVPGRCPRHCFAWLDVP